MRLFPKNKFLMIFPLILKCSVFQYLLVLGKQIALYLAFKNPAILLTGVGILASLNLNYFLFPADETHLNGQTGPHSCCGTVRRRQPSPPTALLLSETWSFPRNWACFVNTHLTIFTLIRFILFFDGTLHKAYSRQNCELSRVFTFLTCLHQDRFFHSSFQLCSISILLLFS